MKISNFCLKIQTFLKHTSNTQVAIRHTLNTVNAIHTYLND